MSFGNNSIGRKKQFEEKYPNVIEIETFRAFARQGRFNINAFLLKNKDIEVNKEYIVRIYEIPEDGSEFIDQKKTTIGKKRDFEEKFPNAIEIKPYKIFARPKGENQGYFNINTFLQKNKYVESNREYLLRVYGLADRTDIE